jgi:hypothetical protein
MKANIDLDIGRKTFASGLLPELIAVLRRSRPGDLVAVVAEEESIGPELEKVVPIYRQSIGGGYGRKRPCAVGFPVRDRCGTCRRQSAGGLAALALYKFRL